MKKINLLDMVKIVSLAVLSMAFLIPTLVPVQAEAWHISGFELKGCAPSWLGGDCDGSPAPAAAATTPAITGSCSANISALTTGGSVVWTVYPAGGNGTYTYSWSGTDSLSGTSNSVTKVYGLSGSKTASVNVVSGGTTKAITCSTIVSVSDSNNNNNNSALSAACYPNTSSTNIGNTVTWVANASGATGNYSYYWSGTDALVGSGSSVSKVYGSTGSKSATVTVTSGSYSQTISCSSNVQVSDYNYNNNNNYYSSLSATCSPNTTSTNVNNSVIWTAYATGGNGSYYYSWNGTDGLYGSGAYASRSYSYAGNKTAYVTITSGGQSITTYCGNSVNVYDNNYSNNYTYSGTNWN
ncbi:MAG: hypothetical protein WCO30_00195, partial [bacterium]